MKRISSSGFSVLRLHTRRVVLPGFFAVLVSACAATMDRQTQIHSDAVYNTLLAEFSLNNSQEEKAVEYYQRAYEKSPQLDFMLRVIEVSLDAQNYTVAIQASQDVLKAAPQHPIVSKLLPYLYFSNGQADQAIELLEDQKDTNVFDSVFLKISAVGLGNENPQNLAGLQRAADHFSSHALAQFAYALAAERSEEYQMALEYADRGIALNPKVDTAYRIKAVVLRKTERLNESYLALKQGLQEIPDSVVLQWEMAETLDQLGRTDEAYQQYQKLYEIAPQRPFELLQALGMTALKLGLFDQAINYFESLADYPGLQLRANYFIGHVLYQRNKAQQAIARLKSIPPGNSVFESAQLLIVRIYREQGNLEQALKELDNAIALSGTSDRDTSINLYLAKGELLQAEKRYGEAQQLYTAAVETFPDYLAFRFLRAYNASLMDDLDTLEQDARYILAIEPDNVETLNLLGYYLADKNIRLEEAKVYLTQAYTLASEDPRIIDSMGWVEFRLNNLERAEELIRQALLLLSDPEIHGHLVEILRARQRFEEANRHLKEALGIYPNDNYLKSL